MRHRIAALPLLIAAIASCQGPPPGGGPGGAQGDGIWLRDARWGEADTFDACLGHQPNNGQYHHHVQPICLRAQLGDNVEAVASSRTGTRYREKAGDWTHSPILGWAFDGHPVYGPYGYAEAKDASSPIRRMKSSFRLRDITVRQTLPEWALAAHSGVSRQLNPNQYGPAVNDSFPLGRYNEDYEYVAGIGDLDQYNGRFAVTPDFPEGTYAYWITLDDDGQPAFPYVIGLQYNSSLTGGQVRGAAPGGLQDYFNNGALTGEASSMPHLSSWMTKNSTQFASAVSGFDPAAGAKTTWPDAPSGATVSGGVTTPAAADAQRVRYSESTVVVTSNNLPSYTIGPWFASIGPGGVFMNWPSRQDFTIQIPRATAAASGTRANTGLGAVGVWVNGVAMFNTLDGASYSNSRATDAGGGIVNLSAIHASAASGERGPAAPGSVMSAVPNFGLRFATEPVEADAAEAPLSLGGVTVTIRDASGVNHAAPVSMVSPRQVNYRIPDTVATGLASVTVSAGGTLFASGLYIVPVYPNLYPVNEPVSSELTIAASGHMKAETLSVTIGGETARISGRSESSPGVERIIVEVPEKMAGRGPVEVLLTADGKASNPVVAEIR